MPTNAPVAIRKLGAPLACCLSLSHLRRPHPVRPLTLSHDQPAAAVGGGPGGGEQGIGQLRPVTPLSTHVQVPAPAGARGPIQCWATFAPHSKLPPHTALVSKRDPAASALTGGLGPYAAPHVVRFPRSPITALPRHELLLGTQPPLAPCGRGRWHGCPLFPLHSWSPGYGASDSAPASFAGHALSIQWYAFDRRLGTQPLRRPAPLPRTVQGLVPLAPA